MTATVTLAIATNPPITAERAYAPPLMPASAESVERPVEEGWWPLEAGAVPAWVEFAPGLLLAGAVVAVRPESLVVRLAADIYLPFLDGQTVVVHVDPSAGPAARARARVRAHPTGGTTAPYRVELLLGADRRANDAVRAALGPALLAEPDGPTPATLRAAGFGMRGAARRLEYRFAANAAEVDAIVRMRTAAYVAAGKRDSSAPPMRDAYDDHALHLAAWSGRRPVAALRMLAWDPAVGFEHDRLVPWSSALPPRDETVEVMRACVDPDAAIPRALLGLLQRTAVHITQLGRRYLLSCATQDNLGLYVRIGCKATGVRYAHAGLGGAVHDVFVADLRRGFYGVAMPIVSYAVLWQALGAGVRRLQWITPLEPGDLRRARWADAVSPVIRHVVARIPRRHRRAL